MSEPSADPQARFLDRIERRISYLKTLQEAGLAVYLPAEDKQRLQAVEKLVRDAARPKELPYLSSDTLRDARERLGKTLEAMQTLLPHDVQYRNRIKRIW
jgi:hypothetical protein